jgi:hypothetical protein
MPDKSARSMRRRPARAQPGHRPAPTLDSERSARRWNSRQAEHTRNHLARQQRLSAAPADQPPHRRRRDPPGRASPTSVWLRHGPVRGHRRTRRSVIRGWTTAARSPTPAPTTDECQRGDGWPTAQAARQVQRPQRPTRNHDEPTAWSRTSPPRDPLEDRHDGRDPAPLPDDIGRGEQTVRVVPALFLLPRGGVTVGKRRHRMDRREEGVRIPHPQLGPGDARSPPLGLLRHDLLTTTSMTATEKESMHPRQRRHDLQHRLGRTGHYERTPEPCPVG